MGRTVITPNDVARPRVETVAGPPPTPDDYAQRLLKYIPPDVFAGYTVCVSTLGAAGYKDPRSTPYLWLFIAFVLVTIVYLRFGTNVAKWGQVAVNTIALVLYVLAQSDGPLSPFVPPVVGAIALVIYVILVPRFQIDA